MPEIRKKLCCYSFVFLFFFIEDRKTGNRGKRIMGCKLFLKIRWRITYNSMFFSQRKVEKKWENIVYNTRLKWKLKMGDKTCRI